MTGTMYKTIRKDNLYYFSMIITLTMTLLSFIIFIFKILDITIMTDNQSFYISFFTNILLTIVLGIQLSISKARIHPNVEDSKDIHLNNANTVIQPRRRYNSNDQPKFSDIMG
jgi:hypothetical protein